MPELLGDDPDIDAFCPQLGGVGVAEAMGVDAFGDPGLAAQTREEDADVAILEGLAVEQAKDRISPINAMGGTDLKPLVKRLERLTVHPDSPGAAPLCE